MDKSKIEKLKQSLAAEVRLVRPIRERIRTSRGRDRYDAWDAKRERSQVRRAICLALAYLRGTPYGRAESRPRRPITAVEIATRLGTGATVTAAEDSAIAAWLGAAAPAVPPATRAEAPQALKLYAVVRADLPPGSQAVQAAHALREFAAEYPRLEQKWHETSNTLVMLAARSEQDLVALATDLGYRGVPVSLFREPDLGNAVTAICVGPQGGRFLRDLPLALGKAA